mgnify:CR=1 FL=1
MKREKTGRRARLFATMRIPIGLLTEFAPDRRHFGAAPTNALFFAVVALLALAGGTPSYAVEEEIVLGGEDGWRDLAILSNTGRVEGFHGTLDLVLASEGLEPTGSTDLFLPFDGLPLYDRVGSYRIAVPEESELVSFRAGNRRGDGRGVEGQGVEITETARFGSGAALFTGGEMVRLTPAETTLFSPGSMVGDFAIDFWLYPNVINEGRSVVRWENSLWNGTLPVPQSVSASFVGQRLEWSVENLFLTPEGETRTFHLRAARPLVPRRWAHHQLSYDASTGLLEYTVDGTPEAVTYATSTGREPGELLYGRVGLYGSGDIVVGAGINGILDELRLSRTRDPEVLRTTLTGGPGEVITRPFDLGLRGSVLTSVESIAETPGGTEIQLFYRLADELAGPMPRNGVDEQWRTVPASGNIDGARGRFLQLRALLLSGGDRETSPRLSQIRVRYEPVQPAPPPVQIDAVARDGAVRLNWSPVRVQGVRGFRVYYGTAPGRYFGSVAANGDSPIDAGSENSLLIEGLDNGVLYFFAVESYDRFGNGSVGELSREVSARPMRWRE